MINKIKDFIKENKYVFLTFLLGIVVISVIYTLQKISPFGNNSMLDVDFYHQYGPLLNEMYDRVKSGETFLYSFNTGGGIPFFRNFLNYLSSPFNVILFFFKKEHIVMAFSVVIGLKAIFAATCMSWFLKKCFNKNNILICVFGILYAFSGYFCAYYWNIMWLDGMVFLPIITYGIKIIVDGKRPFIYIFSLSLMLFANYFIGYMICIWSVLFFTCYFIYKGDFKIKNILKKVFIFLISSLLSAGIIAFFLLPLYDSLSSISATTDNFPNFSFNFNIFDYLFNHFTGVSRTVFASDPLPLPNVYPGMLSLILILTLFFNNKINIKVKVVSLLSIMFFLISFMINDVDFIWHAFHVPNDLPYRYSFIYTFLLVTIGYYASLKIDLCSFKRVNCCFFIVIVLILITNKVSFKNLSFNAFLVCLLVTFVYLLIYLLSKVKRVTKVFLSLLLIITVLGETIFGINNNWLINHDIETFMTGKKEFLGLIKSLRENDNDLYRIERTNNLTLNDGAWFDYYGISTFSSMAYESVAKSQRMLGMAGNNINSYYYKEFNTPIFNTMFSIKYLIGTKTINDYYETLSDSDLKVSLYKYQLPFVYMVNDDILNWNLISYMPFHNQENFALLSSGINDLYEDVYVKEVSGADITDFSINTNGEFYYDAYDTKVTLLLENPKRQNLYFYVGGSNVDSFEIDGNYYGITSDEYYTVDAGIFDEGQVEVVINLNSTESNYLKFYAYSLNDEKFKSFYNTLNDGSLKVKRYGETYIEGVIQANKNQVAFSSIAYDKGWQVFVDGKKVKTKSVAGAFLSFDVPEGKHEIILKYYPNKMKMGMVISITSIFVLILLVFFINKGKMIDLNKKDKINV